jgi:hypothetical protein
VEAHDTSRAAGPPIHLDCLADSPSCPELVIQGDREGLLRDTLEEAHRSTRLLELESQIKRRHLELAIRIKNLLDESLQARLAALRAQG